MEENKAIVIRKANDIDHDPIWNIIRAVISSGDTYVFSPDSSRQQMMSYWCGEDKHTYVATINNEIVGTFILKENQPGLGAHVANASFMTSPHAIGRGVGRAMGEFCLRESKRLGFHGMQFNSVVKSNTPAIALWKKLGFAIVGEVPNAFRHQQFGLTPAYIMYRKL